MKLKELREYMETMYMMGSSLEYLNANDEYPAFYVISKKQFDELVDKEQDDDEL